MTLAELNRLQREKETRQQIEGLHAEYCRLTNLRLPFDMSRERQWWEYIKAGHTKEDLAAVVAFRRRRMKEGRRYPESLAFRNLIGNLDYFAEDLAEARAVNREPKIDHERKFVLEATGRDTVPQKDATSAKQVIQSMEVDPNWREGWEKLKASLK